MTTSETESIARDTEPISEAQLISFVSNAFRLEQMRKDVQSALGWVTGFPMDIGPLAQKFLLLVMLDAMTKAAHAAGEWQQELVRQVPAVVQWLERAPEKAASQIAEKITAAAVPEVPPSALPVADASPEVVATKADLLAMADSLAERIEKRLGKASVAAPTLARALPSVGPSSVGMPDLTKVFDASLAQTIEDSLRTKLEVNIEGVAQKSRSIGLSVAEAGKLKSMRGGDDSDE